MERLEAVKGRFPSGESVAVKLFMWPGDAASNMLGINDSEGRMLFRMFVNVSVYAKIAVLFGLWIA